MGKFIDDLLQWANNLVIAVLMLLPESPIQAWAPSVGAYSQILGWINYFVPLGAYASIMVVYLGAVGTWYIYRWFLRLTRYID